MVFEWDTSSKPVTRLIQVLALTFQFIMEPLSYVRIRIFTIVCGM